MASVVINVEVGDNEDNYADLSVDVSIDSGAWIACTQVGSTNVYTYTWDTTGYNNGNHTIDARVTDTDSNIVIAIPVNVTVVNVTAPVYSPGLLFRLTAESILASNGDAINTWPIEDNTLVLSESIAGAGQLPIYRQAPTGFNGYPAVEFATSGQFLKYLDNWIAGSEWTVMVVQRSSSTNNTQHYPTYVEHTGGGLHTAIGAINHPTETAEWKAWYDDTFAGGVIGGITPNARLVNDITHIQYIWRQSGSTKEFINGIQLDDNPNPSTVGNGIRVGYATNGTMQIAEILIYNATVAGGAGISTAVNGLISKYAIPVD